MGSWYLKVYFLKRMCVYLCAKFQVFNIILTSFRRGSFTSSHPPSPQQQQKKKQTKKRTPKKPTQIRVKSSIQLETKL